MEDLVDFRKRFLAASILQLLPQSCFRVQIGQTGDYVGGIDVGHPFTVEYSKCFTTLSKSKPKSKNCLIFSFLRLHIAQWVKSGKRGNLKSWKVNDNFALIIISFLSDVKLPTVYYWYLGLIIYVRYLRSSLQKIWRGVLLGLKFCVLAI